MKSALASRWSNDYHSFGLSWTPENIEFKIDGESNSLNASNMPPNFKFDSKVNAICNLYINIVVILISYCVVLYSRCSVSRRYDKFP